MAEDRFNFHCSFRIISAKFYIIETEHAFFLDKARLSNLVNLIINIQDFNDAKAISYKNMWVLFKY